MQHRDMKKPSPSARLLLVGTAILAVQSAPAAPPARVTTSFDLRETCGAVGDGVSDDSKSLKTCLTEMQRSLESGSPAILRIPAGMYRISGANGEMPTFKGRGGVIAGDGPHASYLILDKDYQGDLFSWSEAWSANNGSRPKIDVWRDRSGPTVSGIEVTGSTDAPFQQNAFAFYDRNDSVLLRDIEVNDLNGQCLRIGRAKYLPEAYLRESAFFNIKCFNAGAENEAAIEIGSSTEQNSDATNELDLYKVAVFSARGAGLSIRNPKGFSATRFIRFFGLRIEASGGDALQIGAPGDHGQVASIEFNDLSVINTNNGAAIRIGARDMDPPPYQINIRGGHLGPGNKLGIAIDAGRLIDVNLESIDGPISLGEKAGDGIQFNTVGNRRYWHFEGSKQKGAVAQSLELSTNFAVRGIPTAAEDIGAAALRADGPGDSELRMTMDGRPASPYNCFNASYGEIYGLTLKLVATDKNHPENWFSWTLNDAVFSAPYGPNSATLESGQESSLSHGAGRGAAVKVTADRELGCLKVTFLPPGGGSWHASGSIFFVKVK